MRLSSLSSVALAGSVAADDSHYLALIDAERDISQGPKVHLPQFCFPTRSEPCAWGTNHSLKDMTHSVNSSFVFADDITLAEVLDDDGSFRHSFCPVHQYRLT